MGALSRDEFAAGVAKRRRTTAGKVQTPELGEDTFCFVRRLSIDEMEDAGFFSVTDPANKKQLAAALPRILAASLADENGERIFSDSESDLAVLAGIDFEPQLRYFNAVFAALGLSSGAASDAMEEEMQGFEIAQGAMNSTD